MSDNTKSDFIKLAALVYGRYWRTDMATHLGVSPRTVFAWAKPGYSIPHVVMIGLEGNHNNNMIYDRDKKLMRKRKRGE